ncbi:hypothetical protein [Thioclava sp. GXIMD4216]|uniref:Glyceraldehyde-3-phosphate dehydrogenase n=1 Tax=Thioclava litoralis TaxID=3076557 RepID=A0ABZ1DYD9_9RHOB|nr:hypothetical protein RPE78_00530 [Thioclava sp. FTW29]
MTNRIALGLAALIVLAMLADLLLTGGHTLFFLSRKITDLVYYLQFWR